MALLDRMTRRDLYRVVATEHVTPGKGRGMVQAKIRHIKSGAIVDHRFRSGDRVDRVCRWAFPTAYAAITLLLTVLFMNLD